MPNFLVLGTQKGGTTSLQKLMEKHPGIFLPSCKEVQYFSLHFEQSPDWYANHYVKAGWNKKRGDITPFYLFHPKAAERIHRLLPNAKLIALLRDPVERALSQVFHSQRHGFENLGVADALAAEKDRLASGDPFSFQKHSYVARSRYLEQLSRYEELFPKKQILILKSEDLFNKTKMVWEEIQMFLNLRRIMLTTKLPKANSGRNEAAKVDPGIRTLLRECLAETSEGVMRKYGINWGW